MTKMNFAKYLLPLIMLVLPAASHAKLEVFACEPEWAALTTALAGEKANVYSATHAGQDPHHIQARPSLIAKLRKADLAFCTGAELETGWMPMLQRRARNPKVLTGKQGYFEATQQVSLLEKPTNLDRSEGDIHGDGNPHIQLDPRRILKVARSFSNRLQTIDPENKSYYQGQLNKFENQLQQSLDQWQKKTASLKDKRVIVHHREWVYMLDWIGMKSVGSLEPKPGIPPALEHLAKLKKQTADLIILSPLNSSKPSKWLHEQTGTPVVILPQTVNAVPGTDNFIALFNEIIKRILGKVNT
jgi:zinc/manganese transport system substrate-binding protein